MLSVQCFTFNPVRENTYVVYNDQKEACIIDPGCYFASEEMEIKDFVQKNGLRPVQLLNTHCHFDHVFGNSFVHQTWGLEPQLHPLEEQVLQFGPAASQMWGLSMAAYEGPLRFLQPGDVVTLGADELEVLFTPGHSPGSISFYSRSSGFVLGGDVLFNGSVGRTDLPGGDFSVLEKSIREQLYTLPPETVVYSGHGPETTIGQEMRSNPFVTAM